MLSALRPTSLRPLIAWRTDTSIVLSATQRKQPVEAFVHHTTARSDLGPGFSSLLTFLGSSPTVSQPVGHSPALPVYQMVALFLFASLDLDCSPSQLVALPDSSPFRFVALLESSLSRFVTLLDSSPSRFVAPLDSSLFST